MKGRDFISNYLFQRSQTDEEYARTILGRRKMGLIQAIICLIVILVSCLWFLFVADETNQQFVFVVSGIIGTAVAMLLVGLLGMYKNGRLLRNKEKLRKQRLEETDERNQTICLRAATITLNVMSVVCTIGVLVSMFLNMVVAFTIFAFMIGQAILFLGLNWYLKRKL